MENWVNYDNGELFSLSLMNENNKHDITVYRLKLLSCFINLLLVIILHLNANSATYVWNANTSALEIRPDTWTMTDQSLLT